MWLNPGLHSALEAHSPEAEQFIKVHQCDKDKDTPGRMNSKAQEMVKKEYGVPTSI